MKLTTISKSEAFEKARTYIDDFEYDTTSSANAGYDVYRSETEFYDYVCDLGNRLEVNLKDGTTINIYIEPTTNGNTDIEIVLETRTGDSKVFTFERFIHEIRFWFGSGEEISLEDDVNRIISSLRAINIPSAEIKVLRSGLYMTFRLNK